MANKTSGMPVFSRKKIVRSGPSLSSLAVQEPPAIKKNKVLIIAHNHPGFFPGGGEVLAYQLFQVLREQPQFDAVFLGATSHISREAHPGTAFLSYEGRPDEYLFYGDRFDYFFQSQKQAEFLYRDFANFLREIKPDVIHFHHTLRIGVEALRIVRDVLPQARIIYTLHDFIPICHRDGQMLRKPDDSLCDHGSPSRCHGCFPEIPSTKFKLREQFLKTHFALVDAFAAPSAFLAERFIDWGLPREKMHLVPNGTPEGAETAARATFYPGIRNRFGFFGQVSHYKGAHLLVEAAKLLAAKEQTFSVAIHGNLSLQPQAWQERFLADVAASRGVVNFQGRYEPADLRALMANIDWVVVPSLWWENSPLVIAEAFRHGKPVICSNIGGMAEHVQDGVNGLHFKVGSPHALAETMAYALSEETLWEDLHSHITPPVSTKTCLDHYISLYQESGSFWVGKTA